MARETPAFPSEAASEEELFASLPARNDDLSVSYEQAIKQIIGVCEDAERVKKCISDLAFALSHYARAMNVDGKTPAIPSAASLARALRFLANRAKTLGRRARAPNLRPQELRTSARRVAEAYGREPAVQCVAAGEVRDPYAWQKDLDWIKPAKACRAKAMRDRELVGIVEGGITDFGRDALSKAYYRASTRRDPSSLEKPAALHRRIERFLRTSRIDVLQPVARFANDCEELAERCLEAAVTVDRSPREEVAQNRAFWLRWLAGAVLEYADILTLSPRKCVLRLLRVAGCPFPKDNKARRAAFGDTLDGTEWIDQLG